MRNRINVLAATAVCSAAMLLPGCGEDSTEAEPTAEQSETSESSSSTPSMESSTNPDLDAYVEQAEQVSRSMLGDSIKKLYKEFRIEPDPPSGIEYVYVFKKPVDVDQARQGMQSQVSVLRASFRSQIAPEMEQRGFEDPTATWTYLNPDGSEVFSQKFS